MFLIIVGIIFRAAVGFSSSINFASGPAYIPLLELVFWAIIKALTLDGGKLSAE